MSSSDRELGVKVFGGVRTFADPERYRELVDRHMGADWIDLRHFRFGASGLLEALLAVLDQSDTFAFGSGY